MATRKKLTAALKKRLKADLERERAELLGQVEDLDAEVDMRHWTDGGFDDDPADSGSANIERDRAQSLSRYARGLLESIDLALRRMEEGTYGTCVECDNKIEVERLDALPYATLCMNCKQAQERHR